MRTWRPGITGHAVARHLERVRGVAKVGSSPGSDAGDAMAMLAAIGETWHEIVAEMWPDNCRLDDDPGCAFALRRGKFRYIVREGRLVTVVHGLLDIARPAEIS